MSTGYLDNTGLDTVIKNVFEALQKKENSIEDLDVIRLGASLGATALQKHQDVSTKADKGSTLAEYGIEDAYTKDEIDTKVSSVYTYKGSVETTADLPTNEVSTGDVYEVTSETATYSWNGTSWVVLGALVDLSNKADRGNTLAEYGIEDTYTKNELSAIINNNNPIIEDQKSYIIKGSTAFYNYKELGVNIYLMERQAEGYHALNPMGGSGLFVENKTLETITIIVTLRPYVGSSAGAYKFGYANSDASPSDIHYSLTDSGTTQLGSGTCRVETTIPITIPSTMKGFIIIGDWNNTPGYGPLEITECYTNDVLNVNEEFQGMTIKTEALVPTPMILTREEYDAIEPKKNTCMYYIIEE